MKVIDKKTGKEIHCKPNVAKVLFLLGLAEKANVQKKRGRKKTKEGE